ncbi:alpha-L-fucosidase [Paenibacillus agaridevorans]|uniref:alpha-L-fucosidase n=1 Tax=Paenibacillus agaridevorans TaxID=171404 RepID=A0A2R5ERX0_9BACL|nr:alpha-L-fucosidase [Paenibacillus agaridevorans]GBG08409.1 alpha-L-fucosidase [Paenibacillus agaridevorans]
MSQNNSTKEKERDQATIVRRGVHSYSRAEQWVKPENPLLLERLEWFKDQKLGLMMHWAPYSQLGVISSWPLSDGDASWSRANIDWDVDAEEFKQQYYALNKTFNPVRFQPELWAELAAENGFKYLNFTTKHHDGFCMWDTHMTDYSITGPDCPFHTHKYADVCKQLFDAFRAKGLGISTYFSKPDWHTPYYWAPGMKSGTEMSRAASYQAEDYPELWEQFVQFTHEQIMELMTRYGRIDMLWLDGGWVRESRGEDIRLGEVVEKAREIQPWLLTADRGVGGPYENVITPEQTVPDVAMDVPWESCITMGAGWSYRYETEHEYKSVRQLIHLLIEVVAKGGNLALNVGPQPDGRLPKTAISRIKSMGEWLKVYGEAIYGTRICEPYSAEHGYFTRKGDTIYAFYLYKDESATVEEEVLLQFKQDFERIDLVGGQENLEYRRTENGVIVRLPDSDRSAPAPIAHVFRIS